MKNIFHLDKNWGLFIGSLNENILHKHYALQISIAPNHFLSVTDKNKQEIKINQCFISSNVVHQLISKGLHLTILINPLCTVGHQLYTEHQGQAISKLNTNLAGLLTEKFIAYQTHTITLEVFIKAIRQILLDFKCNCLSDNHLGEERIYKAIQYLDSQSDKIISLKEIASFCCLSETRFLHLFKEKTNLNYRRYQLWNRLVKSMPYLQSHSITETAHEFGFTDSSHYTRTFIETFGLTPKFFSKPQ